MTPEEEQAAADAETAETAKAEAAKSEAAKVAADAAAKAEAARVAAASPGNMTEEQIKALEEQTGLSRKQLTAVTFIAAQQSKSDPGVSRVIESNAFTQAKNAVAAGGVAVTPDLEKKVNEHLAKLSPADRQNPALVENVIWIERGKLGAGAAPARPSVRVMSGADDTPPAAPAGADADFEKLSPEEQQYYTLGKFASMKEYNSYKSRSINTDYERGWKAEFRK